MLFGRKWCHKKGTKVLKTHRNELELGFSCLFEEGGYFKRAF